MGSAQSVRFEQGAKTVRDLMFYIAKGIFTISDSWGPDRSMDRTQRPPLAMGHEFRRVTVVVAPDLFNVETSRHVLMALFIPVHGSPRKVS